MPSHVGGDLCLGCLTLCDPLNECFEFVLGSPKIDAVEHEEDDGRHNPCPLVPIDEGVVLNKVVEVGGSHRLEIGVEPLTSEGGPRHCYRRFQQAPFAKPLTTSERSDLTSVDFLDLWDAQEARKELSRQAA